MSTQMRRLAICAGGVVAVLFSQPVLAGDLLPPGGAVAPTMKSLDVVEPRIPLSQDTTPGNAQSIFAISAPGSYYLTGDVLGQVGKNGILISSTDVTIDLNGFRMLGGPGTLDGIEGSSAFNNVVVRNGIVRNWGGVGVDLFSIAGVLVENMVVSGSGGTGIELGQGTAHNCVAVGNVGSGFRANRSLLINCVSNVNQGDGFFLLQATEARSCVAVQNGGNGFRTDLGEPYISVIDCQAVRNFLDGIRLSDRSSIRGNLCANNGFNGGSGAGVRLLNDRNVVENNVLIDNTRGFELDIIAASNLIVRNRASNNPGGNYIFNSANNAWGPIVNVALQGDISSVLDADHPMANFEY